MRGTPGILAFSRHILPRKLTQIRRQALRICDHFTDSTILCKISVEIYLNTNIPRFHEITFFFSGPAENVTVALRD